MASIVQLKRSALSGKVPGTGSLNLGELAVNTYDGKIYFKKSGSIESVESVVTTNSVITGSIRLEGTASFGSLQVNDTLTVNHGISLISGSLGVTSDLTVLGSINARQFNIAVISSSVLFESGSSKFGNTSDDIHSFTGSVNITGSFLLNGQEVGGGTTTGSFTGSFTGDGSGLRGVVSDDIPRDGWDYNANSSASISDFNNVSDKYYIDFEQSQSTAVGTPVGYKGFLTNVSGSTQILPTLDGIDFVVGNNVVASIGVGGIQATIPAGTISGSSQLTSSYDSRYVLSGSITQTTWDNIASKPSGIVSGSSQVIEILTPLNSKTGSYATTGSNTFVGTQTLSGSIIPAIDNTYDLGSATYQWRDIYVSSGSLYIDGTKVLGSTGNELQITTDVGQSIKILEAGSDSIILQSADGDIQLKTSGGGNLLFDPTTGLIDVRGTLQIQDGNKITSSGGNGIVFGNNIVVSGSLESTGNINGINLTTFSSSIASTFLNQNSATSSYETKGSGIISSSAQLPSGVISGSAQLENATITNLTITNLTTVNETASVIFSSGSNRFGDFADDVHDFTGSVKVSGSITTIGSSTATSFNGTINATNGVVSGSSQITYASISSIPSGIVSGSTQTIANLPTGTVSGSSQVVSILSSLNTYTGSNDTTNTAQNSRLTTIESVTGSYETKGRSIVSGSSQIDVMSTTNVARLATTGSNTFSGSQTITGSISTTDNITAGYNAAHKIVNSSNGQVGGFSRRGLWEGNSNLDPAIWAEGGSGVYIYTNGSATPKLVAESGGTIRPGANGTQDLGSTSYRWSTIYTSDLSLNNGIGDWTIVEGEDDLFLYNNKKGKVYKFALTEVDPNVATPKKS